MLPKRRGRPPKNETELPATNASSSRTTTLKRKASANTKGKGQSSKKQDVLPDVFREMLAEVPLAQNDDPERPVKRKKPNAGRPVKPDPEPVVEDVDDEEEEDVEFEDVLEPQDEAESSEDEFKLPTKLQQTTYRDSSESLEDDFDWDDVGLDVDSGKEEPSGEIELTLTKRPEPKAITPRRKAVSKDEKEVRLMVHKMHVLCLLSLLEKRNQWINDETTQKALVNIIPNKTLGNLKPRTDLIPSRQTDLLKQGLKEAVVLWKTKFQITQRGLRRSLWAEDDKDIENYQLPEDSDTTFDKSEFQAAAKTLKGSRDLGAQLFCSMLRSLGIETRLVCSLQALSFNAGGPSMPRTPVKKAPRPTPPKNQRTEPIVNDSTSSAPSLLLNPRARLGHPNAADYFMPSTHMPPPPKPKAPKPIKESPYPVYWIEVFNPAHQNWIPCSPHTDKPLANTIFGIPSIFEPPANDRENAMTYVLAIEDEGCIRDVTLRYTKAYNAKTRKARVESTPGGERWLRRALKPYNRGYESDVDQIEDAEFRGAEAREKMPKNILDYKDHPYLALERHLRRNEILIPSAKASGKVAAGKGKKLESIFKRKDVRVARSANAWYRLGRDVKEGEEPVKVLEPKKRVERDDDLGEEDERAGTNLYIEAQTVLCDIPPVVDGRVPRNKYGNLDVYVPTMVPPGGVHLPYMEAQHAARLIGIDYADAVTGFEFRGRQGTAVIKGVVVATEYKEAVEAVIAGLRDEAARAVEDARAEAAVRMWKRLLVGLRIRERIKGYGGDDVDGEEVHDVVDDVEEEDSSDVSEYNEDEGGGFMPE